MVDIDEITTTGGLEGHVPEWCALWKRCSHVTPFQAPEWLVPWWRHLGCGHLRVLTLRRSGELVGLAPLFARPPWRSGLCRVGFLGAGASDYLGVLLVPGLETEG